MSFRSPPRLRGRDPREGAVIAELSPTARAAIDSAVADLAEGERSWAAQSLTQRRHLLTQVRDRLRTRSAEWVRVAAGYKGLGADSPLVGEEWMSGPYALATSVNALIGTLERLAHGESPLTGATFGKASGRTTVDVLPLSGYDRLLLNGFRAQVWLRPGVGSAAAHADAGLAQRNPQATDGVAAVLGAGNITSIAPLDVLYQLFAHNRVVALKVNPVTEPLLEVLTGVLGPLIDLGVVRILTGGPAAGDYLVRHSRVGHVHMTGSAATHDAIAWGVGADAQRRKAAGTPLLDKPISSELGGVSPTIVLPGRWTRADLRFQAEHIATQRLHNGGYNCVAAQTVLVSADWPQRTEFLAALSDAIDRAPARPAYYPGSDGRVAAARAAHPDAVALGPDRGRLLVADVGADDPVVTTEYFAPVLGVVELPGLGPDFARAAADFANDALVGTLGANIIARPDTITELGGEFDTLVAGLRYGTVAVNAWTAVGYLTPTATWGAFPGHTLDDVQSGIGVVHNALLIDNTERTVVTGPFRPSPRSLLNREWAISPKPPWFVSNRTAARTGRRLTEFAVAPGPHRLPGIFASALRG
ncbi:MAG: aldehyde dehydrogenase family protein [Mycobacteriaceae bacterium]|nr:aldehyde dehydrogenase family protein [Mycobacteriaceae bacterium]